MLWSGFSLRQTTHKTKLLGGVFAWDLRAKPTFQCTKLSLLDDNLKTVQW